MKTTIKFCLGAFVAAAALTGCQQEEVYDWQVTRNIEIYLDGVEANTTYGQDDDHENARYLYFFTPQNKFYANYGSTHNLSLPSGDYKLVCVRDTLFDLIRRASDLDTVKFYQPKTADRGFACSKPINWKAGQDIKMYMETRTGTVRIKATDTKADKSYVKVRTTMTTPVTAWSIGSAQPYLGEKPFVYTATKEVNGGIGYEEDAILIDTETCNRDIDILVEYLDKDDKVVKEKHFADGVRCTPGQTNIYEFELNNPDEDVTINYNLSVVTSWSNESIMPAVKIVAPDGFTYLDPNTDYNSTVAKMLADKESTEVNVYLKAGATYIFKDETLQLINKPIHFQGQLPSVGKTAANVTVGNVAFDGDLPYVTFENLNIKCTKTQFINLNKFHTFHIGELCFKNVKFDSFTNRVLYNEGATTEADKHMIDKVTLDGVKFLGLKRAANAIINLNEGALQSMPVWNFNKCVFAGTLGTYNVIIKGLGKQTSLDFTVNNCVFLAADAKKYTWFNIDAKSATGAKLTVTNNLIGGAGEGGTWFGLTNVSDITASGNTRTAGFTLTTWGVAEPTEVTTTYEEALANQ